ncbi:hypothetical protein GE21DRAFT_7850 [Neurospora crassa]|uniref:Uncharacterized protein n=2 Tax=Neurospora crassa TaxID=5141 RepID=Q1K6T9_NEUCR|nr:hypothetical protein NCU01416 [Neurospora crassa OR74A]EAA31603.1 hypothetical protein NCU01416 [Neurospora crassa OR74A]KHE86887.1 hypothetical protein GE21DRAFT_7850 [Neurospora crassa]CAD70880.1 hypothetical protein [Neurospora crassa]|eukprot:XP_960839.1 hypothetical protein NCU01416 [Neurospora crassa OR74A]
MDRWPVKRDGKDGRLASHQFSELCKEPEPKTRKFYGDDGCLFDVDISMADGRWRPGGAATARFKASNATTTTGDVCIIMSPCYSFGRKVLGFATPQPFLFSSIVPISEGHCNEGNN